MTKAFLHYLRLSALGLLVSILCKCRAQEPPGGYYRSRYDHINVDTVVNSKRLVNYYAACLLNRGPCPPQGAELKRVLPEALLTNCARCTEKQKAGAYRTIKRLRKEYPGIWKELVQEYDPTEKYVRRFEETMLSKKPYLPSLPVSTTTTSTTSRIEVAFSQSVLPTLGNRFGEDEDPPSSSASSITSTTNIPASYSTVHTSTLASSSTMRTSSPPTTTKKYTTKKTDTKTTSIFDDPLPIFIPAMFPKPPTGVTTNTVSLLPGVRLQVDTPNWLSSIGNRVIQTGSRIGKAVVSTVQAVVGR